jgi:hypothetical protein
MAEEDVYFTNQKQPHAIEPGAFVLDLYRLICMVTASREVASHGLTSPAIAMMQEGFFKSEVTRILISCATGLRIRFDQRPQGPKNEHKDCGKLFPSWVNDQRGSRCSAYVRLATRSFMLPTSDLMS